MIKPMQAFAPFMDSTKMKDLLQQYLPDCKNGSWLLNDCSIQHPRYKTYLNPGSIYKSSLSIAYHLSGKNLVTKQPEDKILYAQAYLDGRSHHEFIKNQGGTDCSAIHIADLDMIAWTFPNDPVLTWLPQLTKPTNCLDYFTNSEWGKFIIKTDHPVKVTISIINYRPKLRCTLHYNLHNPFDLISEVFAKSYADQQGQEVYLRTKGLCQHSQNNPDSFVFATALCYDPDIHTLWQEKLSGKALLPLISTNDDTRIMSRIAKGIADFHRTHLPRLKLHTHDDHLAEAHKKSAKLEAAFPDLKKPLLNLISQLEENKPITEIAANTLVHGDFHLQQLLLLDNGRIALFDFDELALGDPMMDLANFSADLYNLGFDYQQTHNLIRQLLHAYQSERELNIKHFDWYMRLQLLTRAYRAYIQQKPNLDYQIEQFLKAANDSCPIELRGQSNV
jgi:thiamine kinase-like enzyme